jgi:hypothetical protein
MHFYRDVSFDTAAAVMEECAHFLLREVKRSCHCVSVHGEEIVSLRVRSWHVQVGRRTYRRDDRLIRFGGRHHGSFNQHRSSLVQKETRICCSNGTLETKNNISHGSQTTQLERIRKAAFQFFNKHPARRSHDTSHTGRGLRGRNLEWRAPVAHPCL